ncbi:phage holin family protein [Flavobacterium ardleyense]|uniref:Phage holin family protein n=1 Tax=Flavobacterium ardleyense TaxID=2038737 RepID=A0ABW5Z3J0_9FLAO
MENIATNIERLYEKAENYTKTSLELVKLKAIDKMSEIISSLAVVISIACIIAMFSLFLNIAVALWIGNKLNDYAAGFLIVSGFYLVAGIVVYMFRREWIKKPIDDLIVGKLLEDKEEKITNLN